MGASIYSFLPFIFNSQWCVFIKLLFHLLDFHFFFRKLTGFRVIGLSEDYITKKKKRPNELVNHCADKFLHEIDLIRLHRTFVFRGFCDVG